MLKITAKYIKGILKNFHFISVPSRKYASYMHKKSNWGAKLGTESLTCRNVNEINEKDCPCK